ncbi:MAG: glycosyltransferase [Sphingobacteriales bacterium]|nr:glycosyltransferase [Sphingobacteriales bacterium]
MEKILFISHSAGFTGAPIVLKHHLQKFKENHYDLSFDILIKQGGELEQEFSKISKTYLFDDYSIKSKFQRIILKNSYYNLKKTLNNNYKIIYGNTVATIDLLVMSKKYNDKHITICHIHELDIALKQFCGEENFKKSVLFIDYFIAASETVKAFLIEKYSINPEKITVHYEYIPLIRPLENPSLLIDKFKLNIFGSGTLDWRKGIDLFIQTAFLLKKLNPKLNYHFYWIGGKKNSLEYEKVIHDIKLAGLSSIITIIENCKNPLEYMQYADVFLLTSREDPFPLVCLEAASLGKPIICFKKAGGMVEFVNNESGWIIEYLDIHKIVETLCSSSLTEEIKIKGKQSEINVKKLDINIGAEKLYKILKGFLEA